MHELSIADSIARIAARHADGRRITKVHVRVGHLRQVVPSALLFAFGLVSEGTPTEGAELVMEVVPASGVCASCGEESVLDGFPLRCGPCGGLEMRVIAGEELYVEALEMEEPEDGVSPAGAHGAEIGKS